MDFDLSWILLGLPLTFVLGWLASRFDLRQLRIENRRAPKAYFKGLNFLLNEQQDQAIDAFIEAVQIDPDTSELHFALGNLFRRRGEYQRAVRVHEHLLSRGDLSLADRQRAQHALALDFLKAGLLDRAEAALLKLEGTPFESQARLALLANYERSRDWPQAAEIAHQLAKAKQGNFNGRLAHYLCEQAAACVASEHPQEALTLLQEAIDTAPGAPRPRIDLAQLLEIERVEIFDIDSSISDSLLLDGVVNLTSVEQTFATALGNRPSMKSAEYRLEESLRNEKVAKAGYYPTLDLDASYGNSYYHTFGVVNPSFSNQISENGQELISLSLRIPIFNRYATRNQVKLAQIDIQSRKINLETTRKTVLKDVQQAYYKAVAAKDPIASKYRNTEKITCQTNFKRYTFLNEELFNTASG